ncbi:hypothetical protein OHP003_09720 [Helicobacter pylori]|nr:hypothetical protein OHP003_09720 [Helicobacter pylori]
MPNSPTKKDYTQYSEKQLFNLINQLEQKIKKMQNDRASFKEKMAKELEKRDQNFKDKIDALNELLQKISQAFLHGQISFYFPNLSRSIACAIMSWYF